MFRLPCLSLLLIALALAMFAAVPPARAQSSADLQVAAAREGVVVIYAATDESVARELLRDFTRLYPGVRVEYHDMNSVELYRRFLAEQKEGGRADVLWSSAMDLQVKLVNDGHAQPHRSAETAALPSWAVWKNEAFGTTFEPVAMVHNREALAAAQVPASHAEFLRLLAEDPHEYRGRLTTYDPRARASASCCRPRMCSPTRWSSGASRRPSAEPASRPWRPLRRCSTRSRKAGPCWATTCSDPMR